MAFPGITKALSATFRHLVGGVKNAFDAIRDAVMGVWEKFTAFANTISDKVDNIITTIFDHIWGAAKLFINRLNMVTGLFPATFRRVWQSIFNRFVEMAKWVKGKIWKAVVDTIEFIWGKLQDWFTAVKMLIQWVQDWGNKLVHMFQNFPEFLAGHLAKGFSYVVDQVGDVLDSWIDDHWED
jgi:phage-related protein